MSLCGAVVLDYGKAKRDLHRWMKEDQNPEVRFTTMFDLYRLPADFPGYEDGKRKADPFARVRCLEESFGGDVSHPQFIPYIQLHEFEALLLSDPTKFDTVFLNHDRAIGRLCKMAVGFESPEQIDDGDATAPSKRIINEIRQYRSQKASAGPLIAEKIGLGNMRARCPHFREWLEKIEALAK